MNQDEKKKQAAEMALQFVEPDTVIGVGTGSTSNYFIEALGRIKGKIAGAVASSEATATLLKAKGISMVDLNSVQELSVYVDGADQATRMLHLIKGGGGALTREKVVAAVAKKFVCIIDDSKLVGTLGLFPLPVEVLPMARNYVARELAKLGGQPELRPNFVTDNGNVILDVHDLNILQPAKLETEINNIAGVVANGIFARRPPELMLVGTDAGVIHLS